MSVAVGCRLSRCKRRGMSRVCRRLIHPLRLSRRPAAPPPPAQVARRQRRVRRRRRRSLRISSSRSRFRRPASLRREPSASSPPPTRTGAKSRSVGAPAQVSRHSSSRVPTGRTRFACGSPHLSPKSPSRLIGVLARRCRYHRSVARGISRGKSSNGRQEWRSYQPRSCTDGKNAVRFLSSVYIS